MANRFPLIVNPDSKEIQELAQNDNLDLTGSGIYAGGSLGQNGQVLATNGTTVEWRTISAAGGGGGGSGVELDTTYVIETQDLADGANLNLIAGGTGVGTISIKLEDNNQIQFDAASNLSLQATIKNNSITNTQLQNSYLNIEIDGVLQPYSLGSTVTIPQYGDVDLISTQSIQNKTFTNCNFSGNVNTFQSLPNSALQYDYITINGTNVQLGGTINVAGGGGGGATYELSAEDWADQQGNNDPDRKAIRLTNLNDSTTDNVLLVAGDRIQLTRSGDEITITGTEVNTDTDTNTTYDISTDTLVSNTVDVGARLKLNNSDGGFDLVNLRDGTGVKVTSTSANDITFSIAQDVSPTSNVEFNNLTLGGSLTVNGALSYINTTNLKVTDKTVTIADGSTNSAQSQGAGILVGTSNINLTYQDSTAAWTSTAHFDLAPTKTYKIGGTEVLTSTRLFGKTIPSGDFIGTTDQQSLSNKTLNSPVMSEIINTGTVYFPAPTNFDTLVARNTNDTLQNKTINGSQNNITNIGNSALTYSYMTINGTQRSLGDSFTITATDPYTDEKAQDTVAGMITAATHSGISFNYDDTTGRLAATVEDKIDLSILKQVVAASTDFTDFQSRIAAL